MQNAKSGKRVQAVTLQDLLGRKPVPMDLDRVRERIQGKVAMVTGAAGSIGSELCAQIAGFGPRALVGFDQAETPLFELGRELERGFPGLAFHTEIGNVARVDDVTRTIAQHGPSIVFHAAAYKHVPMMERHIFAAVENNIFGTWHIANAAASHGVAYFVLISTDKAVRPASILGATKRVAELAIGALQKKGSTKFVAVRFGNVLGSSGSVVPIFKNQIAAGGPVTVTHAQMSRYFMTAREAGQFVLQALVMGEGGETFALDMGEPVKIVDLARDLILLAGLKPEQDIAIEFTGVRSGEKLFEELNRKEERQVPTSHPRINNLVSLEKADAAGIATLLQELQEAVSSRDALRLIMLLKEAVPDYTPAAELLKDAMSIEAKNAFAGGDRVPCGPDAESMLAGAAFKTSEPAGCATATKV